MKKLLLMMLGVLMTLPALAFEYTYKGQTLTYVLLNGEEVGVKKSQNNISGTLTIPSSVEYDGKKYTVIQIQYDAFNYCVDMTSVIIPNSVTSIGSYAFSRCSGLTSVTIGNSVKGIGEFAFNGCSGLTSVTIPNSCKGISEYAFSNCDGLTSVIIPNSVTSIGDRAFYGCSGLKKSAYPNTLSKNPFPTGYAVPYNPDGAFIEDGFIYGPDKSSIRFVPYDLEGEYTIPNSVTEIGAWAFYGCSDLTSINIPESVTEIGESAFEDCSGLTSVTIPNSVTEIGAGAFSGCRGLTSVTIPDSVTEIGAGAFSGCRGLTSVTIPGYVTEIGESAFEDCSGLTSVTIPNSVTEIGAGAFSRCSGLTSVTIPNSVTEIGAGAFSSCSGLTSVTIPNSVTSIGSYAFSGCRGLTSVTIPNSVTSIGDGTFYQCTGLTSVTIPDSVTEIGAGAFEKCSGLTSVTIPNSVTEIGEGAFNGCSGLTSVTIPNSVTSIGDRAFQDCSGLTSVIIGKSVTSSGWLAFYGCNGLKKSAYPNTINDPFGCGYLVAYNPEGAIIEDGFIYGPDKSSIRFVPYDLEGEYTIPNSVTEIGAKAFSGCSDLTSINIPESVTVFRDWAFSGCNGLRDLTIPRGVSSVGQDVFFELPLLKGAYPNTLDDNPFGYDVEAFEYDYDDSFIEDGFVYTRSKDKLIYAPLSVNDEYMIPETVTVIGKQAFLKCDNLTSVVLPENVTSLEEKAWKDCNNIKEVWCLMDTPIPAKSNIFDTYVYDDTTLIVPDGTLSKYKEVEPWSFFLNIVDKNTFTEVDSIINEEVSTNESTDIYSLSGVKVGSSTDSLAPGIYIMHEGSAVKKIVVK